MESKIKKPNIVVLFKDALNKLNKDEKQPHLNVGIYYFQMDEGVTQIFLSNNLKEDSSSLIVQELLNIDDLNEIISYLVANCDFVIKYSMYDNGIAFHLCNNVNDTINFSKVTLRVDFSCVKDKQIMFDYLRAILVEFKEELNKTRYLERKYERYCEDLKYDFMTNASIEEMREVVSSLNKEELTELIKMIPSDYLVELLNNNRGNSLRRKDN
jgi:hypothetical protein